jgi:hypothetical protein
MKNIITILMLVFSVSLFAQELTVPLGGFSRDIMKDNYAYKNYEVAKTLIDTTRDTIWYTFEPNKYEPYVIYTKSYFDTIAGADTTVRIRLYGKMMSADNWSLIKADSVTVAAATTKVLETFTTDSYTRTLTATGTIYNEYTADTTAFRVDSIGGFYSAVDTAAIAQTFTISTVSKLANNYRYLLLEYILAGDDATGEGVEISRIEISLRKP